MNLPLIIITGPTGVGKTKVSIELAKELKAEIVSADSMQIYRYMNIGTSKPTLEERQGIPHYMIDIIEPDEEYSVAQYKIQAEEKIEGVFKKGKIPLLVGGTGLYIKSIIHGLSVGPPPDKAIRERLRREGDIYGKEYLYDNLKRIDPLSAKKIHPHDLRRIIRALEVYEVTGKPISFFQNLNQRRFENHPVVIIGLIKDRLELYKDINMRVDRMIEMGLVLEVKGLLDLGYNEDLVSMQAHGYKEIIRYLKGEYDLYEAIRILKRNVRRYAKRQLTWWRKEDNVRWIKIKENEGLEDILKKIKGIIQGVTNYG